MLFSRACWHAGSLQSCAVLLLFQFEENHDFKMKFLEVATELVSSPKGYLNEIGLDMIFKLDLEWTNLN